MNATTKLGVTVILVALATIASVTLVGCGKSASLANAYPKYNLSVSSGETHWTVRPDSGKPIPGIDVGSVSWLRLNLVTEALDGNAVKMQNHMVFPLLIWSDMGAASSATKFTTESCAFDGSLLTGDGPRVGYRCESRDGRAVTVTIAGFSHVITTGALVLVSTHSGKTEVMWPSTDIGDAIAHFGDSRNFALSHAEIANFFNNPKQAEMRK